MLHWRCVISIKLSLDSRNEHKRLVCQTFIFTNLPNSFYRVCKMKFIICCNFPCFYVGVKLNCVLSRAMANLLYQSCPWILMFLDHILEHFRHVHLIMLNFFLYCFPIDTASEYIYIDSQIPQQCSEILQIPSLHKFTVKHNTLVWAIV